MNVLFSNRAVSGEENLKMFLKNIFEFFIKHAVVKNQKCVDSFNKIMDESI